MHICMRHIAQICNSQRITNQPVWTTSPIIFFTRPLRCNIRAMDEHKYSTSDFTESLMSQKLMHNIYISSSLSSSAAEFSTSRYVALFCPANNKHSGTHQHKTCCTQMQIRECMGGILTWLQLGAFLHSLLVVLLFLLHHAANTLL